MSTKVLVVLGQHVSSGALYLDLGMGTIESCSSARIKKYFKTRSTDFCFKIPRNVRKLFFIRLFLFSPSLSSLHAWRQGKASNLLASDRVMCCACDIPPRPSLRQTSRL